MFISREYDYAVRVLRALADGGHFAVSEICRRENIPLAYSYKILKKLEKAAFVKGKRGAEGGYRLAAPLSSVTLYDIYLAVEGKIYINECLREGYTCPNNEDGQGCAVHKALCGLQNEIALLLKKSSLAEILSLKK